MDPMVLFGNEETIRKEVGRVLEQAGPKHILGVGHGVIQVCLIRASQLPLFPLSSLSSLLLLPLFPAFRVPVLPPVVPTMLTSCTMMTDLLLSILPPSPHQGTPEESVGYFVNACKDISAKQMASATA